MQASWIVPLRTQRRNVVRGMPTTSATALQEINCFMSVLFLGLGGMANRPLPPAIFAAPDSISRFKRLFAPSGAVKPAKRTYGF